MPRGVPLLKPGQFDEIIRRMEKGEIISKICRDMGNIRLTSFLHYAHRDSRTEARYTIAREQQAMAWADLATEIAADTNGDARIEWEDGEPRAVFDRMHVMRATLFVNTLKWRAAKQLPHVYGDRVTLEGDPNNPLQVRHTVDLDEVAGRLSREEREVIQELMDRREARERAKQERQKAIEDKTIEGMAVEVEDDGGDEG